MPEQLSLLPTGTETLLLLEDVETALKRTQGGRYRALKLVAELNALGIDLVRRGTKLPNGEMLRIEGPAAAAPP
jgi:hypothetical protein